MVEPFQILALSGGGVRGVFQARLLELAARHNQQPLSEAFDLIAATSTGALVGLGIAAGVAPTNLVRLYREQSLHVFGRKRLSLLRRGGRYDQDGLRTLLRREFGTMRMSDLRTRVLVASSVVDTYQGRFFTEADGDTSVVDVALATTAAPTYFPPVVPDGHDRGYMDGGLWANDPSFLAVQHATASLGIAKDHICLLSIGTGRIQHGEQPRTIKGRRTLDMSTIRFIYDFTTALQAWNAEALCDQTLAADQKIRINPFLREWIALDDADSALATLPALAESEYDEHSQGIQAILARSPRPVAETEVPLSPILVRGLNEANISKFVPSRKYYGQFREGRESISSYVALAETSLTMVSINLATGLELERVVDVFTEMLDREHSVKIIVSLLDPEHFYLMQSIAPVIDAEAQDLQDKIRRVVVRLQDFHKGLRGSKSRNFELYCHAALPNASAIMIDENGRDGIIQLETKAYQASLINSFGFEVRSGSEFYETLRKAYNQLITDGRRVF